MVNNTLSVYLGCLLLFLCALLQECLMIFVQLLILLLTLSVLNAHSQHKQHVIPQLYLTSLEVLS